MSLNVIERRIRKSLEGETQGITLQGRRITLTPTGTSILDLFEYVKVFAIAKQVIAFRELCQRD